MSSDAALAPLLDELFDAERAARKVHEELAGRGRAGALDALLEAVGSAMAATAQLEPPEASLRLVAMARLLGEFDGPDVADALIDVLGSEYAEARHEAGEQLQGLAFDRFKDVALATERALERFDESPALMELPYLLVEIPEGGVLKLLGMFLKHPHADTVAAGIEALAELADPAAVALLEPLKDDSRAASVAEEDVSQTEVTIGELASEAAELLLQLEEARG